jgi:hypothetical protein
VTTQETELLPEREYVSQRKQIWESMNGCDCPVEAKRDERCTRDAIRCNGRIAIVHDRMHALCKSQDRCIVKGCKGKYGHKGKHE